MNPAELLKRLSSLKSERLPLEESWRHSYHFACPSRQMFRTRRKEDEYKDLYDTTLIESTQLLVSSLQSGTVPANSKWFNLVSDDPKSLNTVVDKYLEQVSDTMFKYIHLTNFDSEVYDYLTDLVVSGWGCLYTELKEGKLNFKCWPIHNVYLDTHNDQASIDCIYREFTLTASVIRNTYKTYSDQVRIAKDDAKFKLVHCIYPNKEYKKTKVSINKNMPYKSLVIECSSKFVLKESGFNTFPVIVSRFNKNHDNLYATGQVNQVLEDARIVNKMNKLILNSAELNLGGIWIAKNDGVINVNTLKLRPRTIIPANSVDDIRRLDMSTNMNLSVELITMYQNRIKRGMMSDQLTPINSSPLSATEVSARVNIIRQQLGAVFIRMQSEFLNGLLERVFDLLYKEEMLPVVPDQLLNSSGSINFIFTNPLSQASKLESVTNTNQFLNMILPLVQIKQDILDNINFDNIVTILQDSLAVSTDVLITAEERDNLRKERAQQQAQAQQQQLQAQQQQAILQDQQIESNDNLLAKGNNTDV